MEYLPSQQHNKQENTASQCPKRLASIPPKRLFAHQEFQEQENAVPRSAHPKRASNIHESSIASNSVKRQRALACRSDVTSSMQVRAWYFWQPAVPSSHFRGSRSRETMRVVPPTQHPNNSSHAPCVTSRLIPDRLRIPIISIRKCGSVGRRPPRAMARPGRVQIGRSRNLSFQSSRASPVRQRRGLTCDRAACE